MKKYQRFTGLVITLFLLVHGSLFAESLRRIGMRPESVTKGFDGKLYVTVMMGKKPEDGIIKVIDGDAAPDFASGFDEPKGIAFVGEYLIVSDLKRVWKINKAGKKFVLVDEKDFPVSISYLNDVVVAPDNKSVFVSDMGANENMSGPNGLWPLDSVQGKAIPVKGRIFNITLAGKVSVVVEPSKLMPCPNGVSISNSGSLLIGGFFTGNLLEFANGKLNVIASGYRGADAIEEDADGNLYVSSWIDGKVWRISKDRQSSEVIKDGMKSAADFFLDEEEQQLVIPDMKAGTIVYLAL